MANNTGAQVRLGLARRADVRAFAEMARQYVELGVGWSWRPERILHAIRAADTVVLGAYARHSQSDTRSPSPLALAVLRLRSEEAHLMLLCVVPEFRRQGIAKTMMHWLRTTALEAGASVIRLEYRVDNLGARSFYNQLGFHYVRRKRGYYAGRVDAIELALDLWQSDQQATPGQPDSTGERAVRTAAERSGSGDSPSLDELLHTPVWTPPSSR